MQFVQA